MAKQTFTTGQILTAAQMTSLQETAMGGGAATAKTSSYVLVAGDAGTTVAMNSSSATTITVNTGLFAAGDTVFIQNLGTGVCTITAGTATVNSAGSLALPQYDGGILYFTSASAAIFYDYIQAGMTSPLTTKGDLWTYTTTDARLASSGVNNDVLTVDTSTASGLKWATPGGALTVASIASGTLSGTSVTVSSLTAYDDILILIKGITMNGNDSVGLQINANATSPNYKTWQAYEIQGTNYPTNYSQDTDMFKTNDLVKQSGGNNTFIWHLTNCKQAGLTMMEQLYSYEKSTSVYVTQWGKGIFDVAAAVSSIKILTGGGQSFTAGTYNIYGG